MLGDGYDYWVMANQIFHGVLNVALNHKYPPLNPIVLSPIFLFGVRNFLLHAAIFKFDHFIHSNISALLVGKTILDKKFSLLFVLTCAVYPFHIVYPVILYSENLYTPLFFWAVYFSFSNPGNKRNVWLWDVLFAISLAALWLTRYMTMPLIPVFMLIWWMKPEHGNIGIDFKLSMENSKGWLLLLALSSPYLAFGQLPECRQASIWDRCLDSHHRKREIRKILPSPGCCSGQASRRLTYV